MILAWEDVRLAVGTDIPDVRPLIECFLALAPVFPPPLPPTSRPPIAGGGRGRGRGWGRVRGAGGFRPNLTLARDGRGYRLTYPGGEARPRSWDAAGLWLLEAIAYAFAQGTRHLVLHAGAIAGPEGAIVFLAPPFEGKTSLAFAAWRRGLTVLGDDRVAIEGGSAFAFPKCLKARVGPVTRGRIAAEGFAFRATMAGDRRLVLARSLPGFARYDERFPIARILVLERSRRARSRIATIPLAEAAARLIPSAGLARRTPLDVIRALKAHSEGGGLPLLRVGDGEVEAALDLMLGRLPPGSRAARRL